MYNGADDRLVYRTGWALFDRNDPTRVRARSDTPIFVSKVDKDGNEIAGVRLPPVEAPIATTTGWGASGSRVWWA